MSNFKLYGGYTVIINIQIIYVTQMGKNVIYFGNIYIVHPILNFGYYLYWNLIFTHSNCF